MIYVIIFCQKVSKDLKLDLIMQGIYDFMCVLIINKLYKRFNSY